MGKIKNKLIILMLLLFTLIFCTGVVSAASNLTDDQEAQIAKVQVPFIENHGQTNSQVKYYTDTFTGTFYVTTNGLTYALRNNESGWSVKEDFQNDNNVNVDGIDKSITQVNYFKGNDSQTNLLTYNQVKYTNLYDNIDLNLKAYGDNIEKVFTVKPGGDPEDIRINIKGSQGLKVNENGELEILTGIGCLKLTSPFAYQTINGQRVVIPVSYYLNCSEYGFKLGNYNESYDLIIDPLLSSTYLGGNEGEIINDIALDSSGNVYITGSTSSTNFPTTTGSYDVSFNGYGYGEYYETGDVFISKFNSNLTSLLASTYLGGSYPEEANAIAIDSSGNVFITGYTTSSDFPTTDPEEIYQSFNNGQYECFISKLSSNLSSLIRSTYFGGYNNEEAKDIALDSSGNVYITGWADPSLPTTTGAYDTEQNGGEDIFVTKFTNDLKTLVASTFLGSTYDDMATGIALDSSGNVYVTGYTSYDGYEITPSHNFPTTPGAYDRTYNQITYEDGFYIAGCEVFVSKFNSGLTSLLASTYLGGNYSERANGIVLDSSGNVYITGWTTSDDFPTTTGVYDRTNNKDEYGFVRCLFISKFNSGLTSLLASTYFDGDNSNAIAIDSSGNIFITGSTTSDVFPTTNGAYDRTYNGNDYPYGGPSGSGDVFISKFNNGLTNLLASTYFGGSCGEEANKIVLDSAGNVNIIGNTRSADLPTTSGAYDRSYCVSADSWIEDGFISKFSNNLTLINDIPLGITAIDPVNNAVNVVRDKVITVTFNKPVKAGNMWIELYNGSTKIPLTFAISGSVLAIKHAGTLLAVGTKYTLSLHSGSITDLAGNSLAGVARYFTTTTDGTAPLITSSDPVNNAMNVARNKVIKLTFSEPVKAGSMWIELYNTVGTKTLKSITTSISGNVLAITPSALLALNTKYTICLHSGSVTDLAGNSLAGVARYFTTTTDGTAPLITSSDPVNNAVNVARNKVIKVTFSESVKASSMWIELYNTVGTKTLIPITTSISGKVLTINHAALLTPGTKYTLAIHTGSVTDLAGNSLAGVARYFSTIDDTAPTVTSTDPASNALNIARNKVITVTFSEPVKAGSMWIELYNTVGTKLPVLITTSISGKVLTINHAALLTPGTKYTLAFHTGSVTDLAGNSLAGVARYFTTGTT